VGGGADPIQKQQEQAQANLANQEGAAAGRAEKFKEDQMAKTAPFYTDMMEHGPSYYDAATDYASGVNAKAYAPARAALIQRLGASTGLPSGSRDQALTDFDEQRAQGYDGSLMGLLRDRQATQERGAAGLMGEAQVADPTGLYSGAASGNQVVMSTPRSPGFAGTLGALLGAGSQVGAQFLKPTQSQYNNPSNPAFSTDIFGGASYT
jgi:hypothetical protein